MKFATIAKTKSKKKKKNQINHNTFTRVIHFLCNNRNHRIRWSHIERILLLSNKTFLIKSRYTYFKSHNQICFCEFVWYNNDDYFYLIVLFPLCIAKVISACHLHLIKKYFMLSCGELNIFFVPVKNISLIWN